MSIFKGLFGNIFTSDTNGNRYQPNQLPSTLTTITIPVPSPHYVSGQYVASQEELLKYKEIEDKYNNFNNETKALYEKLTPHLLPSYTFQYSQVAMSHNKVKICEIIEKHLHVLKFNSKMNNIINETGENNNE